MNKENCKCCLKCAYLVRREKRESYSNKTFEIRPLADNERDEIATDEFEFIDEEETELRSTKKYVECYHSQLSEEETKELTLDFLQEKQCEYFYPYKGCEGLQLEGIEKKQIRQFEIENAITAKENAITAKENAITAKEALKASERGVYISKIVLCVSIFSVVSAVIGAGFATLDYIGDKKWQTEQISKLEEINRTLNIKQSSIENSLEQLNGNISKLKSSSESNSKNTTELISDVVDKYLELESQQNTMLQEIKTNVDRLSLDEESKSPTQD